MVISRSLMNDLFDHCSPLLGKICLLFGSRENCKVK